MGPKAMLGSHDPLTEGSDVTISAFIFWSTVFWSGMPQALRILRLEANATERENYHFFLDLTGTPVPLNPPRPPNR